MSKNLEIRVSSRNSTSGTPVWEGTVSIPGTRPTKLVKRASGESTFNTRSSLLSSARTFAKKIGYEGVVEATKKAAKKSVASKKNSTTTATSSTSSTS